MDLNSFSGSLNISRSGLTNLETRNPSLNINGETPVYSTRLKQTASQDLSNGQNVIAFQEKEFDTFPAGQRVSLALSETTIELPGPGLYSFDTHVGLTTAFDDTLVFIVYLMYDLRDGNGLQPLGAQDRKRTNVSFLSASVSDTYYFPNGGSVEVRAVNGDNDAKQTNVGSDPITFLTITKLA